MNCDGELNMMDVQPFIGALVSPLNYYDEFPTCPIGNGDMNGDSRIDILDINPIVALLMDGG
ncbi:hypothetical protein RAS1_02330 [Phycisphaerae bacterium RAS1]|nr:hypothetical protein RAS1_02330 [Phycisphaerae bacterium RAS1]